MASFVRFCVQNVFRVLVAVRCVKILAAEMRFKLLQNENKKPNSNKRKALDAGEWEEPEDAPGSGKEPKEPKEPKGKAKAKAKAKVGAAKAK